MLARDERAVGRGPRASRGSGAARRSPRRARASLCHGASNPSSAHTGRPALLEHRRGRRAGRSRATASASACTTEPKPSAVVRATSAWVSCPRNHCSGHVPSVESWLPDSASGAPRARGPGRATASGRAGPTSGRGAQRARAGGRRRRAPRRARASRRAAAARSGSGTPRSTAVARSWATRPVTDSGRGGRPTTWPHAALARRRARRGSARAAARRRGWRRRPVTTSRSWARVQAT